MADARIFVVTNAVNVGIGRTIAIAETQCVELRAVAIAVPGGNGVTTALVDGSRSVAHPASVKLAHTFVHVVTNTIGIVVRGAIAPTFSKNIRVGKT